MPVISAPRPLERDDDRAAFDCGRSSLNVWFERHAWQNHTNDASRVNVICDLDDGRIVGFVALSAGQIERAYLPKSQQRNRPDPVPATLLGQLAVHKDFQGLGRASALLGFALRSALCASEHVASVGVMTHPLDDTVRAFYANAGFYDLPGDPKRAMMIRMSELRKNGGS